MGADSQLDAGFRFYGENELLKERLPVLGEMQSLVLLTLALMNVPDKDCSSDQVPSFVFDHFPLPYCPVLIKTTQTNTPQGKSEQSPDWWVVSTDLFKLRYL